jgi:hypothetical protein
MKKRLTLKKLRAKNAKRLTPALMHVAATKARRPRTKGTFGPASDVRHIHPSEAV